MKTLIILFLLLCACSTPACGQETGSLQLRVELVTGERSKDSSSQTTTISIASSANTIVWEQTYGGHHGGTHRLPARKEYKLSSADKQKLIALLESKSLLVTNSIEIPKDPASYLYFALSIECALDGKNGAINIGGPRTAVAFKEKSVYQDAIALVRELYQIINRQGGHVVFEEPLMPVKKFRAQSNRLPRRDL